jgi:hypothetical protein
MVAVERNEWKRLVRDALIVASVTVSGTVLALTAVVVVIDHFWPCVALPKNAFTRSVLGGHLKPMQHHCRE